MLYNSNLFQAITVPYIQVPIRYTARCWQAFSKPLHVFSHWLGDCAQPCSVLFVQIHPRSLATFHKGNHGLTDHDPVPTSSLCNQFGISCIEQATPAPSPIPLRSSLYPVAGACKAFIKSWYLMAVSNTVATFQRF